MTEKKPGQHDKEPPERRLLRYLYIGKEYPEYQPGNWFVHQYYSVDNVPSIEEMVIEKKTETKPLEIIKDVHRQKKRLVQNYETLVFALAVCARQDKSEELRHKAYVEVLFICKEPQHFLLFIKFADQIVKKSEKKHGWGHGWKTAVHRWYKNKTPLELAECFTRYKSRYGWKHKDIFKLAHYPHFSHVKDLKLLEVVPDRHLVKFITFSYVMNGFKEVKTKYTNPDDANYYAKRPDALQVYKYLENVEEFKHCEDEVRAGGLLEMNNLTLDQVPGHLLKSEEVWNSLLTSMSFATLLENLQRIHNLGFLKPESIILSKVIDVLSSEEKIKIEQIHPAHILITVRNYENSGKPLSYEKRKVREEAKKLHPPPPEPNQKVIDVLYKSFDLALANLEPTGVRYLVTIDMSKRMQESRVWRCGNMNAAEVGCLIALSLLRSEKDVVVATFKNAGIYISNLDKDSSFEQVYGQLQKLPPGPVNLKNPMLWASEQKREFDVFINIVDQISEKFDSSEEGITSYRTAMNLPNAKLINCVMCDSTTYRKEKVDGDVLAICGFDQCVPKIIEAFSRSYF